MTPTALLCAPVWLISDSNARPAAIRTEPGFDFSLLPDGWSVARSTMSEALAAMSEALAAAIIAEDRRKESR